jgi:hypothetical protein
VYFFSCKFTSTLGLLRPHQVSLSAALLEKRADGGDFQHGKILLDCGKMTTQYFTSVAVLIFFLSDLKKVCSVATQN